MNKKHDLKKTTQRAVDQIGKDAQNSYRKGVKTYQDKIKSFQDLGRVLNGLTKSTPKTNQDEAVQGNDK